MSADVWNVLLYLYGDTPVTFVNVLMKCAYPEVFQPLMEADFTFYIIPLFRNTQSVVHLYLLL